MRSCFVAGVALFAGGLGGCDPASSPAEEQTLRSAPSASSDLATSTPRRGRVIGGEVVRREVRWPSEGARADTVRAELDDRSSDAIDRSEVPVLVPPSVATAGRVMTGDGWYAFWGRGDAFTVSVQGSARARIHPDVRAADPDWIVRDTGAHLTHNEGIWSVSFIENGAAYAVEVECDEPFAGPCSDEAFVVELAESLVYVGGTGDRR
jgi:hypothetical protein